jgi:hypothetical protein
VWISSSSHHDDDDEMTVESNPTTAAGSSSNPSSLARQTTDPLLTANHQGISKRRGVVSRAQYTPTTWYSGDMIQLSGASGFVPDGEGILSFWIEGAAAATPPSSTSASPYASPNKAVQSSSSSPRGDSTSTDDDKFLVRYRGTFVDGKRHGTGTIINERGSQLTCRWDEDVPEVGKDICYLITEDGDEYVGMVSIISDGSLTSRGAFSGLEWVRSARFVPDATGEMWIRSERKRYCGEWQCGQRHGFGVETDVSNLYCFSGGYQYDSREGSGTLFQSAQRTVLFGLWKDGSLHGSAALHLPNQAALIQSHSWTNIERSYEFDGATILRSRVVDGIWEPLFVTFDSTLALSVAEVSSGSSASRLSSQHPPTQSPRMTMVLDRLEGILEKDDFLALLSTFQRCFYFIYGSCHRFLDNYEFCRKQQKRSAPRQSSVFPESWCCLAGLEAKACMHRTARERTYTPAHLKQAVEYVASFVFSIRLRLLSYLAALPTACDLDVGRSIASMCWDVAFSAVEPLLLFIAESLCKETHAAFRVAAQRCQTLQDIDNFIGSLDLWFPSTTETPAHDGAEASAPLAATLSSAGNEPSVGISTQLGEDMSAHSPQSCSEVGPLSASSVQVEDENPRLTFEAQLQVALEAVHRCGLEMGTLSLKPQPTRYQTAVKIRQTSTGMLFTVVPAQRVRPSALVNDINIVFSSIRSAARAASRPTQNSSALGYLQDQLLSYVLLKSTACTGAAFGSLRNVEALLSLTCLMLSDSIDPPLPGAAIQQRRARGGAAFEESEAAMITHNDSMDGHRMLSGGDATDEERQASFQSTFQSLSLIQALQRVCSTWSGLRIPRWGCLISLEDLLLRIEHGIVVALVKGDSSVLMGSDSGRRSITALFYEDDEDLLIDQSASPRVFAKAVVPLRSCRDLLVELQNAPQFGDLTGGTSTSDFILWMLDTVSSLMRKFLSSISAGSIIPSPASTGNYHNGSTVTTTDSPGGPSPALSSGPPFPSNGNATVQQSSSFSAKKHLKQLQIRTPVWYSDIIPRYVVLANLVSLLGLRIQLDFTSGGATTCSPVAPEDAYYAVLKLDSVCIPSDLTLASFVISSAIDRWDRSVIQAAPQQWRKKVR